MHKAWITGLIFVGLVFGAGCTTPGRFPQLKQLGLFPTATHLTLAGRDATGQEIRLDAYRGQVVLVDVWKTG